MAYARRQISTEEVLKGRLLKLQTRADGVRKRILVLEAELEQVEQAAQETQQLLASLETIQAP